MTYRGHMHGGVVVLDEPAELADGDEVAVRIVGKARDHRPATGQPPTLYEQMKEVIGIAEGLPSDLAENHDHYLHGRPKKS